MAKQFNALDLYVLDALANDMEDIEGILRMLNSDSDLGWKQELGREFSRSDILAALSRLVRADMVRVLVRDESGTALRELPRSVMPSSDYDVTYFAVTGRGRMVHDAWDPDLDEPSA